ncbi:MAG: aminoacyl-tRNA hydrolase, partial [Acidimicrobiales bacterium]|nr:aminoacyl-tRNA hydrolase [Acidimicrobiales bacterium]
MPLKELHWNYLASGGPGGQHSNKNATKVVLTFDIENSDSLGPR